VLYSDKKLHVEIVTVPEVGATAEPYEVVLQQLDEGVGGTGTNEEQGRNVPLVGPATAGVHVTPWQVARQELLYITPSQPHTGIHIPGLMVVVQTKLLIMQDGVLL
jgi:hypothetical protein